MAEEAAGFRLDHLPKVQRQITDLLAQASEQGRLTNLLHALQDVFGRLKKDPFALGDPLYRTKHSGGVVFHAIRSPLNVHYAAYDLEKLVLVLDIAWLQDPPS